MKRFVSLLVVGALLIGAGPSNAEDVANEISAEIMSPFCPGVTLHDCPSQKSIELRAQIAEWARAGLTKAQIIDRLEAEFGPEIHAAPPAQGAGVLAWLLPALALAAGAAVAGLVARRWMRSNAVAKGDEEMVSSMAPDERSRLEGELRSLREQM